MPTYEYECTKGHHFDVVQRISDPPLERCRVCRSKVHRLISAAGFILKGGGWYADGYSSSSGNGRASEKSSSESASSETSSSESRASESKSSS